jgi:hypothetical protein
MMTPGEEKAWEILSELDPSVVCRNTSASYDEANNYYIVRSFCCDFFVETKERTILNNSRQGEILLKKYPYFFIHSCLRYLIHTKDIPLTGRLVKPADVKGGDLFFRGSHILPLDGLAKRYREDRQSFLKKGVELCAEAFNYGDASVRLLPMPKIPVTLILWLQDEEFPERADLLFDSSCELQVPIDIIWSIAMMSILVML